MYYLLLNGTQSGPYAVDKIKAMLNSGEIDGDTLFWTEGQADWQPVRNIPGLAATVPPPAPVARRSGLRFFLGGVGLTLAVIGALLLLVVVGVGGMIGYAAYKGSSLDKSSKAYVDEAVPAIVTNWSEDELTKRESEAFQNATSQDQLDKLFTAFRKLGPMKSYNGCTGDSRAFYQVGKGNTISAQYVAKASFEKGNAEINISLIQTDGVWKILGFRVDSSALFQ